MLVPYNYIILVYYSRSTEYNILCSLLVTGGIPIQRTIKIVVDCLQIFDFPLYDYYYYSINVVWRYRLHIRNLRVSYLLFIDIQIVATCSSDFYSLL